MIKNCKCTCITLKVKFFNKTEVFYTYILWPNLKSLVDGFAGLQCAFLEFSKELISYFSVSSGSETLFNYFSYQKC